MATLNRWLSFILMSVLDESREWGTVCQFRGINKKRCCVVVFITHKNYNQFGPHSTLRTLHFGVHEIRFN